MVGCSLGESRNSHVLLVGRERGVFRMVLGPLCGASSMNRSSCRLAEFIHRCGSRCGFLQRALLAGCFTDPAGCFREQIASRVCLPGFLAMDCPRRVEAELFIRSVSGDSQAQSLVP